MCLFVCVIHASHFSLASSYINNYIDQLRSTVINKKNILEVYFKKKLCKSNEFLPFDLVSHKKLIFLFAGID